LTQGGVDLLIAATPIWRKTHAEIEEPLKNADRREDTEVPRGRRGYVTEDG